MMLKGVESLWCLVRLEVGICQHCPSLSCLHGWHGATQPGSAHHRLQCHAEWNRAVHNRAYVSIAIIRPAMELRRGRIPHDMRAELATTRNDAKGASCSGSCSCCCSTWISMDNFGVLTALCWQWGTLLWLGVFVCNLFIACCSRRMFLLSFACNVWCFSCLVFLLSGVSLVWCSSNVSFNL